MKPIILYGTKLPKGNEDENVPACIDAEKRRRHVIDAAFRLIEAEGLEGLTLRKVAAEAALNIGSVRHFFNGHEDLLAAAANEAGNRMGQRLIHHPVEQLRGLEGDEALDALQVLLEQVLPVDEERRTEAIIVIEFIRASRTRAVFAPSATQMERDLHYIITAALDCLQVPSPNAAARQVSALVGGLTLDTVTPHGALTVCQLRSTLRDALRNLLNAER